jgi:hypothetical protein
VSDRFFTIYHDDALRFRRVPVMLLVVLFVMVMLLGRTHDLVLMLVEADVATAGDAVWPGMSIRSCDARDRE